MANDLNGILKESGFSDAHVTNITGEGYDLDGFSTLTSVEVVDLANKGITDESQKLKRGNAASALKKVERALAPAPVAPVVPQTVVAPVVPATTPVPVTQPGVQRLQIVDPYKGALKDVLALLVDNPEDDAALQRVTELTTSPTGEMRETFIVVNSAINPDLTAELNQILARTNQVKLAGLYKGHKPRTMTQALKLRVLADPRDQSVMLVESVDETGRHLTSTLDGVDWQKARANLHIISFARLYMPQVYSKLEAVDGFTLADELASASHPRYAVIRAEMDLAETEEPTKIAAAKQALFFKNDSEVGVSARPFPGGGSPAVRATGLISKRSRLEDSGDDR